MSDTEAPASAAARTEEDVAAETAFDAAIAKLGGRGQEESAAGAAEAGGEGAAAGAEGAAAAAEGDKGGAAAAADPKDGEKGKDGDGAASAQPAIDWSKLPAEAKAAYDAANERATRLQGMVTPLQRQNADLSHELRRATAGAAGKPAPGKATAGEVSPDVQALLDSEKIKQVVKDIPELEPIVDALKAIGKPNKDVVAALQTLEDERTEKQVREVQDTLLGAHPDFYTDVAKSPKFFEWAKAQPKHVRTAINRNSGDAGIQDVEEVIGIVSEYKKATGIAPPPPPADPAGKETKPAPALDPKRQRQMTASAAPRTSTPGRVSSDPTGSEDPSVLFEHAVQKLSRTQGFSPTA